MGPWTAFGEAGPGSARRACFVRGAAALGAVVLGIALATAPAAASTASARPHDATSSIWAAPVEVPQLSNAGSPPQDLTQAITCNSSKSCVAVGDYIDASGDQQGLISTEVAGAWKSSKAPLPANAGPNPDITLDAVACSVAGACAAMGTYLDTADATEGLILTEKPSGWTATEVVPPSGIGAPVQIAIIAVDCPAAGSCIAVGSYVDSSGVPHGLLLTLSSGIWTPSDAPLPAEAGALPQGVTLNALSCPAATYCVAVGQYVDSSSTQQGLVLTWVSGKWSPTQITPPSATDSGIDLTALSCPAAGSCVAGGTDTDSTGIITLPLLVTQSVSGWTDSSPGLPASPTPASAPAATVAALSCVPNGACTAVGQYLDTSNDVDAFVLSNGSGSWTVAETALPAQGVNVVGFTALACPAAGSCVAAGSYTDSGQNTDGLLLSETSGIWSAMQTPLPEPAEASTPVSTLDVMCTAAATCAATGSFTNGAGTGQGFLLAEAAGTWTPLRVPPPPGVGGNPTIDVTAVSCPSDETCGAAGTYVDDVGETQGLLVTRTTGATGTWSATEAPLPSDAGANPRVLLGAIDCPAPGSCTAAGTYVDGSAAIQGVLLTLASGVWSAVEAPLPGGGTSPTIAAISCEAGGSCAVAGTYTDGSGIVQGLLLTGAGASWTPTEAPMPAGVVNQLAAALTSVACPSTGACDAAGDFTTSTGIVEGLLLTQVSGSVWTPTQAPLPAGAATNPAVAVDAITCPAAGSCVAAGQFTNGGGQQALLLVQSGPTTWTPTDPTLPAAAAANPLASLDTISCPATNSCVAAGAFTGATTGGQGLLLTMTSGAWVAGVAAPVPAGAAGDPQITLSGVACPATGACTATGTYTDGTGNSQGLLLSATSGTWTAAEAPLPGNASSAPGAHADSVSCVNSITCLAVGTFTDSSDFSQSFIETSGIPTATTVSPSLTTATVGQTVTLTATLTATTGTPTGTVAFSDAAGTILGCDAQPLNGGSPDQATCVTSFVPAGSYTVTATYAATNIFSGSAGNTSSITVNKAATTAALSLSTATLTYGSETPEVFTVTVTGATGAPDPTGTANVVEGTTTICAVTLANATGPGVAATGTCSPTSGSELGAGSDSVTATYVPGTDPNYNASSSSPAQTLTINKAATTTKLVLPTGAKVTYGKESAGVFTATVTGVAGAPAPTGTVVVDVGTVKLCTATLASGTGHCSLLVTQNALLSGGVYKTITATYVPPANPNYAASTSTPAQTLTVLKAASTISFKMTETTAIYGAESKEVFTATVGGVPAAPKPTGQVVMKAGTVTLCVITLALGTGHCGLTNTQLKVASAAYHITATYVPGTNPNYNPSGPTAAQLLAVKA